MRTPRNLAGSVVARAPDAALLKEHDVVRLRGSLNLSGREYRKGAVGTIVGIWRPGELYEVEFTEPAPAVETVPAGALELAAA